MNLWDVLILLALAASAVLALFRIRRRRKSGRGCCGNCEGCCFAGSSCPAGRTGQAEHQTGDDP